MVALHQMSRQFISSLRFAWAGIRTCLCRGRNFRAQAVMAVIANYCSLYFHISPGQASVILLCTALVLSLEMINTSIEKLCDFNCKDYHPLIKQIKDIAAGAVLIASLISLIIAAVVFVPKIYPLI